MHENERKVEEEIPAKMKRPDTYFCTNGCFQNARAQIPACVADSRQSDKLLGVGRDWFRETPSSWLLRCKENKKRIEEDQDVLIDCWYSFLWL